jgi:Fe2+ transport system protein FeoA
VTPVERPKNAFRPLDCCRRGERVRVAELSGGWGVRQRLTQMGIHEGDLLDVKRSAFLGGPQLIEIHGSDVALGREISKHVIVEAAGE